MAARGGKILQTSQKRYDVAQREALMLRGKVIDLFAQVERAVTTVLIHAASLPEYKALKPAFPHLMGQKLERLRKLMSEAGPLKSQANKVNPLVDKLNSIEHFRRFMAHGTVEVALTQGGDPIYVFSMICAPSEGSPDETLTLTGREAQSSSARLANIARDFALKLEALTDGMDKHRSTR